MDSVPKYNSHILPSAAHTANTTTTAKNNIAPVQVVDPVMVITFNY